jgi:hypothetical protein
MKFQKFTFLLLLLLISKATQAQKFPQHPELTTKDDKRYMGKTILLHLAFAHHFPAADLKKRFGNNNTLGGGLEFMPKNNFIFGFDGHFIYGQKVKEDPLKPIRTDSAYIISGERTLASVVLRERGFYAGFHVGKLFTFDKESRR